MALIIGEGCIDIKDKACTMVCPMDCIYGEDADRMLYINADDCIDCGACETECPTSAIFWQDESKSEKEQQFIRINELYLRISRLPATKLISFTLISNLNNINSLVY